LERGLLVESSAAIAAPELGLKHPSSNAEQPGPGLPRHIRETSPGDQKRLGNDISSRLMVAAGQGVAEDRLYMVPEKVLELPSSIVTHRCVVLLGDSLR
jgi:hypothetical protein